MPSITAGQNITSNAQVSADVIKTGNIKDGEIVNADIAAAAAIAATKIDGVARVAAAGTSGQLLTSNGAGVDPTFQTLVTPVSNKGTWAMDGSANKAVAHGLGKVPQFVIINSIGNAHTQGLAICISAAPTKWQRFGGGAEEVTTQTEMDATNFYVPTAMNLNTYTGQFFAVG